MQVVKPTYSSTLIRFKHRFAAFQSINFPAALTHEDYAKNSDFSPYKVDLIYKSAEECFKVARAHGEELLRSEEINDASGAHASSTASGKQQVVHGAEVEALMKVAIANSVSLMRRDQQAAGSSKPAKKALKNGSASVADGSAASAAKAPELLDFSVHPHFPVVAFPNKAKA